jgi:hypothetical protein
MRLHSDFHDYYDTAIGWGIDDKVHFNRFTKAVEIEIKSPQDRPFHRNSGLLGFCGQIYPYIEIHRYDRNFVEEDWIGEFNVVETRYAFDLMAYEQIEKEFSDFSDDFGSYYVAKDAKIKQFYLDWSFSADDIFLELQVPIWSLLFYTEQPNGLLNPRLKDYGFDAIKDSFTAFQEISMYLSNILVEQKKIAEVDDRHRIEQHGFDIKTSFRKGKGDKKL